MKIQCNVCEAAEAVVLCCADEAALCLNCDQKVHAANKLASKHQRVPISCSSSEMPKCDICQETAGYFFCLEDRALLCRKCDVAIHTANSLVSVHQRFLLTGVKVGLEANEAHPPSFSGNTNPNTAEKLPHSPPKKVTTPVSSTNQYGKNGPIQASVPLSKLPSTGGISNGSVPMWQLDEFIGLDDFTQNYNFMSNGSSKDAHELNLLLEYSRNIMAKSYCKPYSGKLGDSDCSQMMRPGDAEFESDDCLGQVPETYWAVPQITSPPTASGLYWPKNFQNPPNTAAFVPNITSQFFHHQDLSRITNSKRRRNF